MDISLNQILYAFGLTVLAGLSTAIGGALALYTKQTNTKFLSWVLGFSAGVMLYVSLVEIFAEARSSLESYYGSSKGYWITTLSFFGGMALIALIDKFVPSADNPHELRDVNEVKIEPQCETKALYRMGVLSALAIAIHNFPEGIATFATAIKDPALGVTIAAAIAIHNIPEGIAISIPVYYATRNRKKAFGYAMLSGLAEPLGAIIGYFLLMNILNDAMFGIIFAGVAGIMVFISLDELLPTAEKYGEHHVAIYGLISGMAVMALSLLLFS